MDSPISGAASAVVLDFEEYGDAIGQAWTVLREHANRAGPHAAVPTCPGWQIRDLVAHQGMVHRWAAANVRAQPAGDIDANAFEREGLAAVDQLDWLDLGARELLQALVDAPVDLDVPFFLHDPPAPRIAWARRQAHETTIHGVDAMAASGGAPPSAEMTWIRPRLAADGIDELLTGFAPRAKQRLRADAPYVVEVRPDDVERAWSLELGPNPPVVSRKGSAGADVRVGGTAAQIYLALWNRGAEAESSDPAWWEQWRGQFQVRW